MENPDIQPPQPETAPPKSNLGAKLSVLGMGWFLAGKLSYLGAFIDASNLFPKDTPVSEKFKRTFSKEFWPLIKKAVAHEKNKGSNAVVAWTKITKWSLAIPTLLGIALGALGWRRADLIQDSKDILHHPFQSAKIIFGLEPPGDKVANQTKTSYSETVLAERTQPQETQIQR